MFLLSVFLTSLLNVLLWALTDTRPACDQAKEHVNSYQLAAQYNTFMVFIHLPFSLVSAILVSFVLLLERATSVPQLSRHFDHVDGGRIQRASFFIIIIIIIYLSPRPQVLWHALKTNDLGNPSGGG